MDENMAVAKIATRALQLLDGLEARGHEVREERALALLALGHTWQANWALEACLPLFRELGMDWAVAYVLVSQAYVLGQANADDEATAPLLEEALAISLARGDLTNIGHAANSLATVAMARGQVEKADTMARQALAIAQQLGDPLRAAWACDMLSATAMVQGRLAEALSVGARGLDGYKERGDKWGVVSATARLGIAAMHLGDYVRASQLSDEALTLCREHEMFGPLGQALLLRASLSLLDGDYAATRDLLAEDGIVDFRSGGGRRELDHADAIRACALHGLGLDREAKQRLRLALELVSTAEAFWPLVHTLAVYALILIDCGLLARAIELYATASRYPFVANSQWFADVFGEPIEVAASGVPPDLVNAARGRGRARELGDVVAELVDELGGAAPHSASAVD
jgi:tetratricopeptide (TPR) repeat protein